MGKCKKVGDCTSRQEQCQKIFPNLSSKDARLAHSLFLIRLVVAFHTAVAVAPFTVFAVATLTADCAAARADIRHDEEKGKK